MKPSETAPFRRHPNRAEYMHIQPPNESTQRTLFDRCSHGLKSATQAE